MKQLNEFLNPDSISEENLEELTPQQRQAKKDYKDSQKNGVFSGDKGKDPLTYGKTRTVGTKIDHKTGKRVYDTKRTNAHTTTKKSNNTKASKADTNKVKDSIRQHRGQGDNGFAPHHPQPKPKLPKDRKRSSGTSK